MVERGVLHCHRCWLLCIGLIRLTVELFYQFVDVSGLKNKNKKKLENENYENKNTIEYHEIPSFGRLEC